MNHYGAYSFVAISVKTIIFIGSIYYRVSIYVLQFTRVEATSFYIEIRKVFIAVFAAQTTLAHYNRTSL